MKSTIFEIIAKGMRALGISTVSDIRRLAAAVIRTGDAAASAKAVD